MFKSKIKSTYFFQTAVSRHYIKFNYRANPKLRKTKKEKKKKNFCAQKIYPSTVRLQAL